MMTALSHEMSVGEAATLDVIAVRPDTSLAALAHLFVIHDIAGAPVIDDEGRVLGVVTATDLLDNERRSLQHGTPGYYRLWRGQIQAMGLTSEGMTPGTGIVADVMTATVFSIDLRATVSEAARLMLRAHIHRLVIVDGGRAYGLITAMDCLRALVSPGSS